MAKKEKAPKVKKEKPPKKKKEPKVKKEKGGKKKLPLILIPVLLLIAGALVFLLLTGRLGKKTKAPEEPPPEETETLDEEPAPEPEEEEKEPEPTMTVDETVDFILTLSPSLLGLEGDTMEGYTAHTTSGVYPVDGLLCTQVNVYRHNAAGTNDIQGCYLLSRGSVRRLYRLDPATREVTEIPLE